MPNNLQRYQFFKNLSHWAIWFVKSGQCYTDNRELAKLSAIPGLTFLQRAFPEIEQITSRSGNHHPILGLKSRWFPLKISKPGIAAKLSRRAKEQ